MTLKDDLVKLAYENPELREELLPLLKNASEPEAAAKLLSEGRELEAAITKHAKAISKALMQGEKYLENASKYGDGISSAPNFLAAEPLDEVKKLYNFLGNVITQIERLKRHGR